MKKTVGFFSLLLSGLIYGSFGIWIRILDKEMTIYQQIVLRNGFAFVIALLVVFFTKQIKNIQWKKVSKVNLLFYIILVPLSVIAYNISILNTKIVLATFAFYVGTIITGWFIGTFFYKESLTVSKVLSLILVFIGLILFAYPFSNISLGLGFFAGVTSGIIDGSANAFRKDLSGKVNKLILILLTSVGGVIISGIMIFYFRQNFDYVSTISTTSWLVSAFFGSLLIILNYLLLVGFQNFDLSLASIVLSLELFFALILGVFLLGEYPSTRELMGGLFILLANIVPNLKFIEKFKLNSKKK